MNQPYLVLASRMRQEIEDVAQAIGRAETAIAAIEETSKYHDLLLDSAALKLHDFYSGLERIFQHIAGGLFDELTNALAAIEKDRPDVFVVQAGVNYPAEVSILL